MIWFEGFHSKKKELGRILDNVEEGLESLDDVLKAYDNTLGYFNALNKQMDHILYPPSRQMISKSDKKQKCSSAKKKERSRNQGMKKQSSKERNTYQK